MSALRNFIRRPSTAAWPPEGEVTGAFLGAPSPDAACDGCGRCAAACPSRAILVADGAVEVDLGRCVMCAICAEACQHMVMSKRWDLAARDVGALKEVHPIGR